jgi:hypothetical protein
MKRSVTATVVALAFLGVPVLAASGAQATAPSVQPAGFPGGYDVVESAQFSAPSGARSHGSVACPGTTLPSGGGGLIASSAHTNLASSYPSGSRWEVEVTNNSTAGTTFHVYAVCLNDASSRSVVTGATTVPPGDDVTALATCPSGRVVLGGGGRYSGSSTEVTIQSSQFGTSSTWAVDMVNRSSANVSVKAYAVCRSKPAGYSLQTGTAVTNPAGHRTTATVDCPGNSVAIGGGGFTNAPLTSIHLKSSDPDVFGWAVTEANASETSATITAVAVCAGT